MNKLSLFLIVVSTFSCCVVNSQNHNYIGEIQFNDSNRIIIENPVVIRYIPHTFKLNLKDTANILLEGKNINIVKNYKGDLVMNVRDSSSIPELIVYRSHDSATTKLFSTYIRTIELPIFVHLENKYPGSTINFDNLRYGLKAEMLNFNIDLKFPIKSFTIALPICDTIVEIDIQGYSLQESHIEFIKGLCEYQPVIFKNIMIEKRDGTLKKLDPIFYILKNKE